MSKSKSVAGRSKGRKSRPTGQARARLKRVKKAHIDGPGVSTVTLRTRSGQVTVLRSSQTGGFTTVRSAAVLDTGTERFAGALRRLATK